MAANLEKMTAELAEVEAAISAALTGQEYEIQSVDARRRLKRQSLDTLYKRRAELGLAIDRLEGSGARGVRHGLFN